MDEIKKVIDKLDGELQKLGEQNEADKTSIGEKQASIDTLTAEIDALQKDIAGRKEDMAKLEQKKSEAEEFNKSIEEVAPLIKSEDVVPEVQEETQEATFDVPTPTVEDVQTPAVEDVQTEEAPAVNNNLFFAEQAPVEETQAQDIPTVENNSFPNFTAQAPVEDTESFSQAEEPAVPQFENTEEKEEMVNPFRVMDSGEIVSGEPVVTQSSMADFNAGSGSMQTFNPAPVFDENGFDITNANTQIPDISINEMYNQDPTSIVR